MANYLENKQVLVGITGGIAAYKAAELVRMLKKSGAIVRVVMTPAATTFITPLTLQALSGLPVHTALLDEEAEAAMGHISLAKWADIIIIAPASADFMAKLAQGHADDLLSTLCLATSASLMIAPAMNQQMWASKATQCNVQTLKKRNMIILGPADGEQACGDTGLGRMLEAEQIFVQINAHFSHGLFAGVNVLITAGPTQEAIDPVRYLSNHSSGKMGYALANAFVEAGANVTLISGVVNLMPPKGVNRISVVTAQEMLAAVKKHISTQALFIATAAVSDYRVATVATKKIKKTAAELNLLLIKNPDILAEIARDYPHVKCIGFAAETNNVIDYAKQKLTTKKLSMIIANQVGIADQGFQSNNNQVTVITATSEITLEKMSKDKLARKLVNLIKKEELL
ncbi:MAG: bifunctional phosphopantothenoylcysteine decarboxylase/phosphopantothenate--cysteine ligase CoaBC [Legionellales bacterium]|nr:bifunctional phosphopantothenoylcysteine decarboxylase/phosphopantothenate--cysteine ligase CoaBC [Legionellales bacterium]